MDRMKRLADWNIQDIVESLCGGRQALSGEQQVVDLAGHIVRVDEGHTDLGQ